ncbi:hypothetical protein F5Y10DRAFT_205222 [Nemania abortiva]|nr:hypothetical protein F5Y10DRAFT_205222 [Nemania abortiva]
MLYLAHSYMYIRTYPMYIHTVVPRLLPFIVFFFSCNHSGQKTRPSNLPNPEPRLVSPHLPFFLALLSLPLSSSHSPLSIISNIHPSAKSPGIFLRSTASALAARLVLLLAYVKYLPWLLHLPGPTIRNLSFRQFPTYNATLRTTHYAPLN